MLAISVEACGGARVNCRGRHEPNATVMVLIVVPAEEGLRPGARLEQAAKALRIIRLILQGFELRFGKWIVVGDVRSRMTGTHPQIGH